MKLFTLEKQAKHFEEPNLATVFQSASFDKKQSRNSGLVKLRKQSSFLLFGALVFFGALISQFVQAQTNCNYSNFANWTASTASTATGSIKDLAGVTSIISATGSILNVGTSNEMNDVNTYLPRISNTSRLTIDNAAEPEVSGVGPFIYTFTISNSISNLIMNFTSIGDGGKKIRYTFKDAGGAAIPFIILKTNNTTNFAQTATNVLEGFEGNGSIRFLSAVTFIRMEVTYLLGNTVENSTRLTFAVSCPNSVVSSCDYAQFSNWTSNTAAQALATVIDNNGNNVNVTLAGSILNTGFPGELIMQAGLIHWDQVHQTAWQSTMLPNHR